MVDCCIVIAASGVVGFFVLLWATRCGATCEIQGLKAKVKSLTEELQSEQRRITHMHMYETLDRERVRTTRIALTKILEELNK